MRVSASQSHMHTHTLSLSHTHTQHTHKHTHTHTHRKRERESESERERERAHTHTHTHTLFVSSVFWTFFLSLCFSQAPCDIFQGCFSNCRPSSPQMICHPADRVYCVEQLTPCRRSGLDAPLGPLARPIDVSCHCLRLTCQLLFSSSRLHHKESLSEVKGDCLYNRNPLWTLLSSSLRMTSSQRQVLFDIFASHFLPHTFPSWASVDQNTQKSTACRFYALNRAKQTCKLVRTNHSARLPLQFS